MKQGIKLTIFFIAGCSSNDIPRIYGYSDSGAGGDDLSVGGGGIGGMVQDHVGGAKNYGGNNEGGDGGSGGVGDKRCEPPQHICSNVCEGNTPQTGCYQSTSCNPCPFVTNGTTKCTNDGLCDFDCAAPYVKSGSICSCPTQCCSNEDCSNSFLCENGQCVEPCDQALCTALCLIQNKYGVCLARLGNQCVCL